MPRRNFSSFVSIKRNFVTNKRQNLLNEKLFLVIFGYPCVHRLHCIPINHPASSSLPSSISLSLLPPFLSPFTISRQRKQGKIWINMVFSKAFSSRHPQGIILYRPRRDNSLLPKIVSPLLDRPSLSSFFSIL